MSRHLKVAVTGAISSGKSSLVNSLLGLDLCQVSQGATTRAFVELELPEKKSITQIHDLHKWKKQIRTCNKEGKNEQLLPTLRFPAIVPGIAHKGLTSNTSRSLEIIDTPGVDEVSTQKISSHLLLEPRFKQIQEKLNDCDVVVVLISISEIDRTATDSIVHYISSTNTNIVIAISQTDKETKPKKICEAISSAEQRYLCPCIAVSAQQRVGLDSLVHFIVNYNAMKTKYLKLKQRLLLEAREVKRIPITVLVEALKKWGKDVKKAAAVGTGVATAVGGALVAGGAFLLLIPGLGTAAGAASITSGLAALGGTVAGGVGVVAGTAAVASVIGGLAGGITSTVVGTSIANKLGAKMTHAMTQGKDVDVENIQVDMQHKAELDKLLKNSLSKDMDQGIYKKYYPKSYLNGDELISDVIIVKLHDDEIASSKQESSTSTSTPQLNESYYFVKGLFLHRELYTIQDMKRIEFITEAKKRELEHPVSELREITAIESGSESVTHVIRTFEPFQNILMVSAASLQSLFQECNFNTFTLHGALKETYKFHGEHLTQTLQGKIIKHLVEMDSFKFRQLIEKCKLDMSRVLQEVEHEIGEKKPKLEKFADLELNPVFLEALQKSGITTPTPSQLSILNAFKTNSSHLVVKEKLPQGVDRGTAVTCAMMCFQSYDIDQFSVQTLILCSDEDSQLVYSPISKITSNIPANATIIASTFVWKFNESEIPMSNITNPILIASPSQAVDVMPKIRIDKIKLLVLFNAQKISESFNDILKLKSKLAPDARIILFHTVSPQITSQEQKVQQWKNVLLSNNCTVVEI